MRIFTVLSRIFTSVFLFVFLISCDEVEELEARKDPSNGSGSSEIIYSGALTITSDPFAICDTSSAALMGLDFEVGDAFGVSISGNTFFDMLSPRLTYDSSTYGTNTFSGKSVANDTAGDFSAYATGCSGEGGYADVIEVNMNGSATDNRSTIDSANFQISAQCINSGTSAEICSGLFSGGALQ